MVETNDSAVAVALVEDTLRRLGKARLALDLARILMAQSSSRWKTASDKIASAETELRMLVRQ